MNPSATEKELKSILSSNLEEVNKLEKLINNLLRLSRLEADELRENFGLIYLREVINDAIAIVMPQSRAHKIEIEAKLIDSQFYGDQDSITQLMVIFLDNAIKYSPNGSKVKIETIKKDNKLLIKIKDQGIGIDKESLEHIFDRFYRAESSRNKASGNEGYGLGLSIAKMIADVHGAVINISSQPEKGTEVVVELPISIS
jgi:two-component system sensor histidine kinase ResE